MVPPQPVPVSASTFPPSIPSPERISPCPEMCPSGALPQPLPSRQPPTLIRHLPRTLGFWRIPPLSSGGDLCGVFTISDTTHPTSWDHPIARSSDPTLDLVVHRILSVLPSLPNAKSKPQNVKQRSSNLFPRPALRLSRAWLTPRTRTPLLIKNCV